MNKTTLLSFLIIIAASCNNVYREYEKESFPNYIWKSGQEISFAPVIEDVNKTYDVLLGIRHFYEFQLPNLSLTVKTISPSGKETTKDYNIALRSNNNEYLSECAGDICDLETVVDKVTYEEAGEYKYIIKHNVQSKRLPGIMEIGLIIDKK